MWLVAVSVPYCVEMGQKGHKRDKITSYGRSEWVILERNRLV